MNILIGVALEMCFLLQLTWADTQISLCHDARYSDFWISSLDTQVLSVLQFIRH